MSHVPWLGPYLGRVPFIAAAQAHLMKYCHKLTLGRLQKGSHYKDLFHYLVRVHKLRGSMQSLTGRTP